jgi:hypothetical protein
MKLEWLVPVIVVIIYVIGWIVKAKEEIDAKAKRPIGKAPGQELDKFLQEIERLRRQNEAAPEPVARRDVDDLENIEIKRPPVIVPIPPPPVVVRSRPAPTPAPTPSPARPRQPKAAKPRPAAAPASKTPNARPNELTTGVMALIRNPRTIANAMVLNEIFGPPKSKR